MPGRVSSNYYGIDEEGLSPTHMSHDTQPNGNPHIDTKFSSKILFCCEFNMRRVIKVDVAAPTRV